MRAAIDTFLHFLADNLAAKSIPVHPLRRDPANPDSDLLQLNAVNVQFSSVIPRVDVAVQLISVDVVHEDELTALDWVGEVWKLLSSAFYTPKYDYTNPAAPVATGDNVMWEAAEFRKVFSRPYAHFNSTFELRHHIN